MRVLATFLCVFLLLMVFGTGSYIWLLWHHYWERVGRLQREQERINSRRSGAGGASYRFRFSGVAELEESRPVYEVEHVFLEDTQPKSRLIPSTTTNPPPPVESPTSFSHLTHPTMEPLPRDKIDARISHYQTQIISQFRNAVLETGRGVRLGEVKNAYRVNFVGNLSDTPREQMAPEELVCETADQVEVDTFGQGDAFFAAHHLSQYFWPEPLFNDKIGGGVFNTCAVVSSSGSLKDSGLGSHIDSNDMVIRFNDAPTVGHEKDVGSKTSLRIVNSQVVGKPHFRFLESTQLYSGFPILVWDPAPYDGASPNLLQEWYKRPDYPFFESFFSKRLMRPGDELHLLKPASLWSIWNWLQRHTNHPLLPNPPSSGFLGLLLSLRHCRTVRAYEYVPSMRLTKRCHYYDEEENLGCTVGDWHPLAAEKLLALAMNTAEAETVFAKGYLEVPGVSQVDCKVKNSEQ